MKILFPNSPLKYLLKLHSRNWNVLFASLKSVKFDTVQKVLSSCSFHLGLQIPSYIKLSSTPVSITEYSGPKCVFTIIEGSCFFRVREIWVHSLWSSHSSLIGVSSYLCYPVGVVVIILMVSIVKISIIVDVVLFSLVLILILIVKITVLSIVPHVVLVTIIAFRAIAKISICLGSWIFTYGSVGSIGVLSRFCDYFVSVF